MIERLTRALRRLARDGAADDLAGEFADALLLAESCQQELLSREQRAALTAVELALEREQVPADEVRRRAGVALAALGVSQ